MELLGSVVEYSLGLVLILMFLYGGVALIADIPEIWDTFAGNLHRIRRNLKRK